MSGGVRVGGGFTKLGCSYLNSIIIRAYRSVHGDGLHNQHGELRNII